MTVDENWLTDRFEEQRPRLRGVAYRMLGSASEADDAVQEAWLRLHRSGADDVENLQAWLTTVVARVCLNMLRSRDRRREAPLDDAPDAVPHGGDPLLAPSAGVDPEQEAVLADSVGLALLVVLDSLAPAERLAFVLHDMFDLPFDEIAPVVGRTTEATRQLASRARRRVRGSEPPRDADLARRRRVVEAYLAATRAGDFEGLVAVLAPEVVLRADAGALPSGRPVEIRGSRDVALGALASAERARLTEVALVDGEPGLVMLHEGRLAVVLRLRVVDGLVTEIDVVGDPDRLDRLDLALLDA
ncbi:sigma-70 family RNA polymerase sigma factor [Cellulosimicrobium cellulans]|uniref:sigma-70 family RNA polymerase sigma factor n=1 Tax=Cellulosimicrobium cellulans TaxID=1710 RepID=UPI0027DE0AAF|nr:sigma-70 family RNA polymerase sigma factor [Cellulosimicrobium cellulans]